MALHRVLVTGAAGRIGSAFVRATAEQYAFRLGDRVLPPEAGANPAWMQVDITDPMACEIACAGMDTVLH